jgi:uncharacterized protein
MMKNRRTDSLIVFTRFPESGITKTRLIPILGAIRAANLQKAMTKRTLEIGEKYAVGSGADVVLQFEGGSIARMKQIFGAIKKYLQQQQGDLGERMDSAFRKAFEDGREKVVLIGTDTPGIDADILGKAFGALDTRDLVFGPAKDGGYYLIGMTRPHAALFENISWGSARVLEQSIDAARKLGLSTHRLEVLEDVDRPEDVRVWEMALSNDMALKKNVVGQ